MARLSNEVLNTASLARALTPFGLNLIGVASVASYDAQRGPGHRLGRHLRGAESAIVVGNGGGAFWRAYRRFCAARPAHEDRRDPLDDFTREIVETALAPLVGDTATDCEAERVGGECGRTDHQGQDVFPFCLYGI